VNSKRSKWLAAVLLSACCAPLAAGEQKDRKPPATTDEAVLLDDLPVVEAAALRVQSLKEAPANVTVVTAAEIQRYGYRTMAEVLDSVRGFYVTNDHMYRFVGVRGLSLPGDFNTRFLVMINGHPLTDNVYNSNGLFGQDFGLDMDLVDRVEIIRGPTSALYGSNGILANINVITKAAVDQPRARAIFEAGSFGETKTGFTTSQYLGKGVNLLLSASVFRTAGQSLFLPGYGNTGLGGEVARRLDAENGYHSFAQLTWGNWSATGYFNSRRVLQPQGVYEAQFNNPGNSVLDQRNFVTLSYTRGVRANSRIRWRTAYDQYRYRDVFVYDDADGAGVYDIRDNNWGDWLTSQLSFSTPVPHLGMLTFGGEVYQELRNLQLLFQTTPVSEEQLRISKPNRGVALFAQQEIDFSPKLRMYAGLRHDYSRNFRSFLSPRVAVVFDATSRTTFKFSYARAFRNPSTYEKYFEDVFYQLSNPGLQQERTHAFEATAEGRVAERLNAVVNVFHYRMKDIIQSDVVEEDGRVQYSNAAEIRLSGVEAELYGNPAPWIETGISAVYQRTLDLTHGIRLVNSPRALGKVRLGVPFANRRGLAGVALRSWDSRLTGSGLRLSPVVLMDATLTAAKLNRSFDFAVGVRNLLNRTYEDPVDLTLDRIRANGRTVFVRLAWNSVE
jgi:outer membrane receptor for ferrienterochelin and colicins